MVPTAGSAPGMIGQPGSVSAAPSVHLGLLKILMWGMEKKIRSISGTPTSTAPFAGGLPQASGSWRTPSGPPSADRRAR